MSWPHLAAAVLENEHVLLRPLSPADRGPLSEIALDPDIWTYFVVMVSTAAEFDAFFDDMLTEQAAGRRTGFCITERGSGRTAGSMSFCNLAERDRRLEIGLSWLGRDFRGRGINRWAKWLMMRHAFEVMRAERVEFKTDRLNERARRGLRNVGAAEEGILRSYNFMPDGRRRDAVFYSVLRAEWPDVRQQLLAGPKAGPGESGR
jgi:RimJ/RimL family protein N-acetyltransferase